MKKMVAFASLFMLMLSLTACGGQQRDLVDMESTSVDEKWAIVWEDRTYSKRHYFLRLKVHKEANFTFG